MMLGTYTDLFDSPLTPYTTLIPLIVVLAITMGKEGFEDIKRHTADLKTNNRESKVIHLTTPGEFETIYWKNVKVGRYVIIIRGVWVLLISLPIHSTSCVCVLSLPPPLLSLFLHKTHTGLSK